MGLFDNENETGYKQRVVRKAGITFYNSSARKLVNGGMVLSKIYQLDDDSVSFNLKDPILYRLLSIEFSGPKYHEEVTATTTPGKQTVKKKRHGLSGAIIGGALTGGIGAVAGGLVGRGMGKDKISTEAGTTSTSTKMVEDRALTVLKLEDIETAEKLTLQLSLFNSEFVELSNFTINVPEPEPVVETEIDEPSLEINDASENPVKTPDDAFDEIRKYKALLDDDIISQEEFDAKKKELLGL
ncbi:MAG: SHOCT domain-containing protein [Lactobacillus sp.]|jgi:hypothetical protein|nr:SHOCT domain-containing protein [Lactobacillus sp.]